MSEARFRQCKKCERNGNVGFSGPPECDLSMVPEPDGSCTGFTTELVVVEAPKVEATLELRALRAALAVLKPVAARSRYAGNKPIVVELGPGNCGLRTMDGETDLRITHGTGLPTMGVVVPWDAVNEALQVGPQRIVLKVEGNTLRLGDLAVEGGPWAGTEFTAEVTGPEGLELPPLGGTCTYLVRALPKERVRPILGYALLELPHFTFVTTDGHRLHVQHMRPWDVVAPGVPENSLLLTKEQLFLLWDSLLEEKALYLTDQGCRVTGVLDGLRVEMDFKTGTGEFPAWRQLFVGYENEIRVSIEDLRGRLEVGGEVFELSDAEGGTRVEKGYVKDVLVGWVDAEVGVQALSPTSPLILRGSDRAAVIMYATEVKSPIAQSIEQEANKMAKRERRKESVQTSAQPAQPAVRTFEIGQEVPAAGGTVKVLKDRVAYLVQLPNGKKRWFSDAGLRAFISGQPVSEEATNEQDAA